MNFILGPLALFSGAFAVSFREGTGGTKEICPNNKHTLFVFTSRRDLETIEVVSILLSTSVEDATTLPPLSLGETYVFSTVTIPSDLCIIFTQKQLNVGKCTIYGSYGYMSLQEMICRWKNQTKCLQKLTNLESSKRVKYH